MLRMLSLQNHISTRRDTFSYAPLFFGSFFSLIMEIPTHRQDNCPFKVKILLPPMLGYVSCFFETLSEKIVCLLIFISHQYHVKLLRPNSNTVVAVEHKILKENIIRLNTEPKGRISNVLNMPLGCNFTAFEI